MPWYRSIALLRAGLCLWAVLFLCDLYLLLADPSRWVQHALQLMLPIVFALSTASQLRIALRARSDQGLEPEGRT